MTVLLPPVVPTGLRAKARVFLEEGSVFSETFSSEAVGVSAPLVNLVQSPLQSWGGRPRLGIGLVVSPTWKSFGVIWGPRPLSWWKHHPSRELGG